MDFKSMLHAISRPRKNAVSYDLSTDFKYTGLQEYPRPQLQRKSYINLNGKWDYRILSGQGQVICSGPIEVPFSPETSLSGTVQHVLLPEETLDTHDMIHFVGPSDSFHHCHLIFLVI